MSNTLDRRRVRGSMLEVDNLYGTAFVGEEDAHTFRITDYEGSEAVAFAGEIAGKFVNPAGVTVPLSGSLDDAGRALVTLDEHCYAVEGRFILTIWAGSEVIYCGVGQVMNSQTDTIDYPTAGIPDVAALIQQLQTILNNWPADYSQLQSDVSSLKSAVEYNTYRFINWKQGSINATDGSDVDSGSAVEKNCRTQTYFRENAIVGFYKPSGVRLYVSYYTSDKSFIKRTGWGLNVAYTETHDTIMAEAPNAKYIRIIATINDTTTTPADLVASGLDITFLYDVGEIKSNEDQYIKFENAVIIESLSINYPYKDQRYKNMIVSYDAMYTGTDAPTIEIGKSWADSSGTIHEYYGSGIFTLGEKNFYRKGAFRVAPWMENMVEQFRLIITIPSGTTLYLRNLHNEYDNNINRFGSELHLNAHGYSGGGMPANTKTAFCTAARLGYGYCITTPKRTSDGTFVCIHDDSLNATARNADGSDISSEYLDKAIDTFTYDQLKQFDFGIYRGKPFEGESIPTLEDFFDICARTGMHPMLSVHPSLDGYWGEIKELAKKHGVLDTLNIKAAKATLPIPMAVLLNDVESYTLDINNDTDTPDDFTAMLTQYNIAKPRKIIEYFYGYITDAKITAVLNAGYVCGCANYGYHVDRVQELIKNGVTEFTEDYNASVGLNWY